MTQTKTARYGDRTQVPPAKSRDEIYRLLDKHGATSKAVIEEPDRIGAELRVAVRMVRITVDLPHPPNTLGRTRYSESQLLNKHEREIWRRWRVLLLMLKSRLEEIADDALDIDTVLMPYLVLPDGRTVAESAITELREARAAGRMPTSILPSMASGAKIIELPERAGGTR